MKQLSSLITLSLLVVHLTLVGQPSSSVYSYEKDNFSIRFEAEPNVSATNSKSTYSVTSLKDSVIYRVIVDTDVEFTVDTVKRTVISIDFLGEWTSYLDSLGASYERASFRGTSAIISRGEVSALGVKTNWKTMAFMKFNRFYTINVAGLDETLDMKFQTFIETFQFLR